VLWGYLVVYWLLVVVSHYLVSQPLDCLESRCAGRIVGCGGAICYRSKLQPTVSTSSTEAEFIAAVTAAKAVKYLRSILSELGDNYKIKTPTIVYEDSTAAIEMINAGKPTNRTRHVDIQLFAIQELKNRGDIVLSYIPGIINIANALTKALGWILHNRHVRRAMGHFYPPWKKFTSWIQTTITPPT
jgi:hypothetical protein